MAHIYVLEAANLFCGADDINSSKHLTLRDLKLPTMEEKTQEHHPGARTCVFAVAAAHHRMMAGAPCPGKIEGSGG